MPRSKAESPGDALPPRSSDPGMVIAFDSKVRLSLPSAYERLRKGMKSRCHPAMKRDQHQQVQPLASKADVRAAQGPEHSSKPQQLDLLNFEDLSIDPASSTSATEQAPSTAPARQSQPVDYLSRSVQLQSRSPATGQKHCDLRNLRKSELGQGTRRLSSGHSVCSLSETEFGPESSTLADPFGPSTFGSTDSGAHSATAAHSKGFGSHTFSPGPPSSTQVCAQHARRQL